LLMTRKHEAEGMGEEGWNLLMLAWKLVEITGNMYTYMDTNMSRIMEC